MNLWFGPQEAQRHDAGSQTAPSWSLGGNLLPPWPPPNTRLLGAGWGSAFHTGCVGDAGVHVSGLRGMGPWPACSRPPGRGGCSHSCDDFMTFKWQRGREQGRIVFAGCKQQVWKSLGKTGPPALVLKVTPISSKSFPKCLSSPPKPLGRVKSQGGPLQPGSRGRNVKRQTPFRWVCWF